MPAAKAHEADSGQFDQKQHTVIGERLCGTCARLTGRSIYDTITNGSTRGYPDGLARRCAAPRADWGIVDVYDASRRRDLIAAGPSERGYAELRDDWPLARARRFVEAFIELGQAGLLTARRGDPGDGRSDSYRLGA